MYRILIVDDDATLRIGLKTIMDWPQYGYELVGEAKDGAQGLEQYLALHPDIVITDMKMPNMDGVALIRALRKQPHPPVMIALSGYDEYALVREAMKYGAADYLLKLDLSPKLLLKTLSDALPQLKSDELRPAADRDLQRTRALHDLVAHFYLNEEDMSRRLLDAGIRLDIPQKACLLIKIGDIFRFEETTEEEYHTLKFSVINIAEEIANECLQAYCIENKTGEFYLLGCVREQLLGEDMDELLIGTGERIHDMLLAYLGIGCTVGIGRANGGLGALQDARLQAAEAVQYRFYAENSDVLLRSACPIAESREVQTPGRLFELRQQLLKGLSALDGDAVREVIEELTAWGKRLSGRNEMLTIALDLSGALREFCDRCGLAEEKLLGGSLYRTVDVLAFSTLHEFLDWLSGLEQELLRYLERESKKGYQGTIRHAQELIASRYCEELSLQQVADELHLTPGYLSTLMKKYTGMTFVEYVTHVRIQVAKEQLETTDRKVYEIADALGYQDQFYFSRLFKRATGLSPAEYRKRVVR